MGTRISITDYKLRESIGAITASLGSLFLYLSTIAPTIQGFDSAELTMGAFDLGFVHPPGYPLYLLLGNIFLKIPFGDVGFRMNMMSAIFASLATFILFKLLYKQTRSIWASLLSSGIIITSPLFWSQAIRAEVYTLHIFLMVSALYAWFMAYSSPKKYRYLICFLILGIAAGNHPTTLMLWASMLIVTLWFDRSSLRLTLLANLAAILLTCAFYLYFPWRSKADLRVDYIRPYFEIDPGSIEGVFWIITGQAFSCLFTSQGGTEATLLDELQRLFNFLWEGTLGFGLILGVIGWQKLSKFDRPWNYLLTLYFITNSIMFIIFRAVDKEVMFLPMLVIIGFWSASGFTSLTKWITSRWPELKPEKITASLGGGLITIVLISLIVDWPNISLRHDQEVYDFSQQVLSEVNPNSTIVSHWATAAVFDYLEIVESNRSDVDNINIDFYFLGIQRNCSPITTNQLINHGWIQWLEEQSNKDQLCFIEPLHQLPKGLEWHDVGNCWHIMSLAEK